VSPQVNEYGDVVLTEAAALRVMAEPGRLELFETLSRQGPLTAEALAALLGTDPAETMGLLNELAGHDLVSESGGTWSTVAKGVFFEIPDDPETADAARALSNVMLGRYVDLPRHWIADDEPQLELDWARASGMLNAGFSATADELRTIQDQLEQVLAPYTSRAESDVPADARRVRVLAYFLPSAPS
jgi:hypothetical protein